MKPRHASASTIRSSKLPLSKRALLTEAAAIELGKTFKVLANSTRLRLLHALVRQPGLSVTVLASRIGMKPQAVSNQLQRLTDKGILTSVRNGTNIDYRVIDPCIVGLLDQGLCLTEDTWRRQSRARQEVPKPRMRRAS